jgi:hypothetical protein
MSIPPPLSPKLKIKTIDFETDGSVGIPEYIKIPWNCTIKSWTLTADISGSAVIELWKDTYANYPPTVADKISASTPPTLTSQIKNTDSTLIGWTTSILAGDFIAFNVLSSAIANKYFLQIELLIN